jgi:hypothetical protein
MLRPERVAKKYQEKEWLNNLILIFSRRVSENDVTF